MGGGNTRVVEAKPLLLVVHDRPETKKEDKQAAGTELFDRQGDWTFTIWNPELYHRSFSNPKSTFPSDHPNFRQPVPVPRIDVYVGKGGAIDWKNVKVPENVKVIDMRAESAPEEVKNGGVVRGGVFGMSTHQCIAGAKVALMQRTGAQGWRQIASAETDENGHFDITAVPEGYYDIQISREGYAARDAGIFDNHSGHAYLDFDALISRAASLRGIVVDDKGKAISGVKVLAMDPMGIDGLGYKCAEEPVATTDAKGGFEISSLPEGYTSVRCLAQSLHQQTSIFNIYRAPNSPSDEEAGVKIVVGGTGIVRGKVVEQDGKAPQRTIIVELEPKGGSKIGAWGGSMQCKEGGEFEFSGVPPGEYVLTAKPNPYRLTSGEAARPKLVVVTVGSVIEEKITVGHADK